LVPVGDPANARQITKGRQDGGFGLSWTPGGDIIFSAPDSSQTRQIWTTATDGRPPRRLTSESGFFEAIPSVCGDGRHFVYLSYRAGTPHIWRSKLDGSDARQLTNGAGEFWPSCSPDGTWFTYSTRNPNGVGIWRVSMDGGNAVRIWETYGFSWISPDGKWVAIVATDGHPENVMLIPAEGGKPVQSFSADIGHFYPKGWAPDGKALLWIKNVNGVMNVWQRNLELGEARQLTRFDSLLIDSVDMSLDGKKLAVARYSITSDVVLINDLDAK